VEYFDKLIPKAKSIGSIFDSDSIKTFKKNLLGIGRHYNGFTKQIKEEKRLNIKAKGTCTVNFSSRTIKVFLTIFA
jgi:hypothetical protein